MKYIVAKEIRSETKVSKNIYLFDLFFILIYFSVSFLFGSAVHPVLKVPYYIWSLFWAVILTSKSFTNRDRRVIESFILFLKRDKDTYNSIKNYSKKREEDNVE